MPQRTFILSFYCLFYPKTWNAISFHEHSKPLNHVSPLSCSLLNYLFLHFELYSLPLSQATLNCHNFSSWPMGQTMGYQFTRLLYFAIFSFLLLPYTIPYMFALLLNNMHFQPSHAKLPSTYFSVQSAHIFGEFLPNILYLPVLCMYIIQEDIHFV